MPRTLKCWLCTALACMLMGAGGPALAGEAADLMKATNSGDGGDPAKIQRLRALLREAERDSADRRQAENAGTASAVVAPAAAGAASEAGKAPASAASAAPGAAAAEAAKPEPPKPPPAVTQPGCMYRGTELIWERKPGTCH